MRNLLFNSLLIILITACSNKAQSPDVVPLAEPTDTLVELRGAPVLPGDTPLDVTNDGPVEPQVENENVNKASVEQKAAHGDGKKPEVPVKDPQVVEHGSPDKAKLDSLKAAKTKGKF
jgi:hypothetical protein